MRQVLTAIVLTALCAGCSDRSGSPAAAPSQLTARFEEDGSLSLTWNLGDDTYDGLAIEARQEQGPWQALGELGPTARGASVTVSAGVPELSILFFRVGGRRGVQVSWSEEVATQKPLHGPAAITLTETTQVHLAWTNASLVATTPEVARRVWSATSVTDWELLPAPEGATSLTDERRPAGQGAEYRVRYVHQGTPGVPAYAVTSVQPLPAPPPTLEVVPGVGIRVTPPPLGAGVVRYLVADEVGVTGIVGGPGPLDLPRWPPSPLTRVQFDVPLFGGGQGMPAALVSSEAWLPAYTVPGDRAFLASSVPLPRGAVDTLNPGPARGGDGRFLGCEEARIWVGQPDEADAFTVDGFARCASAPATDRLGRVHALAWRVPDTNGPGTVLTHVQRDASGWQAWDVTGALPAGAREIKARVAADGTVHVLYWDGADGGRYLVGTGGTFVEEPALAGAAVGLEVAPDGTAYVLTGAGLFIRDPLGTWSDGAAPAELFGGAVTLLAKDGGRLAVARMAAAGAGWELVWRERNQGVWGDEVVAARSSVAFRPSFQAALGDDGDLAVIGGAFEPTPGAGSQAAVFERRGGVWRHVPAPTAQGLRTLGLAGDKLWVLGWTGPHFLGDLDPERLHFALYQDP